MFGPLTRWYLVAIAAALFPPLLAGLTRLCYHLNPWPGWIALAWACVLFALAFVGGGMAGLTMHGIEMAPPRGQPGWGRLGTQLALGLVLVLLCLPATIWILRPLIAAGP